MNRTTRSGRCVKFVCELFCACEDSIAELRRYITPTAMDYLNVDNNERAPQISKRISGHNMQAAHSRLNRRPVEPSRSADKLFRQLSSVLPSDPLHHSRRVFLAG